MRREVVELVRAAPRRSADERELIEQVGRLQLDAIEQVLDAPEVRARWSGGPRRRLRSPSRAASSARYEPSCPVMPVMSARFAMSSSSVQSSCLGQGQLECCPFGRSPGVPENAPLYQRGAGGPCRKHPAEKSRPRTSAAVHPAGWGLRAVYWLLRCGGARRRCRRARGPPASSSPAPAPGSAVRRCGRPPARTRGAPRTAGRGWRSAPGQARGTAGPVTLLKFIAIANTPLPVSVESACASMSIHPVDVPSPNCTMK